MYRHLYVRLSPWSYDLYLTKAVVSSFVDLILFAYLFALCAQLLKVTIKFIQHQSQYLFQCQRQKVWLEKTAKVAVVSWAKTFYFSDWEMKQSNLELAKSCLKHCHIKWSFPTPTRLVRWSVCSSYPAPSISKLIESRLKWTVAHMDNSFLLFTVSVLPTSNHVTECTAVL